jgi:stalled ribosome rescue protein Dom34
MNKHAVLWIDHAEARVFHFQTGGVDRAVVEAPHHLHRKHPKTPQSAREHPDDAKRFFHDVAGSLEDASALLIVGPGSAKLELLRYLHKNDPQLESKIIGIETVDHPTDKQVVAYATSYFQEIDRTN